MENEKQLTKKRGGARLGSGRKKIPENSKRVQMVVTVLQGTRDNLRLLAKERGTRVGRIIDEMFNN